MARHHCVDSLFDVLTFATSSTYSAHYRLGGKRLRDAPPLAKPDCYSAAFLLKLGEHAAHRPRARARSQQADPSTTLAERHQQDPSLPNTTA